MSLDDSPTIVETEPIVVETSNDSAASPAPTVKREPRAPDDVPGQPSAAEVEPVPPDVEAVGLTRGDRLILLLATFACLVALTVQWVRLSDWGTQPIEVDRQTPLFLDSKLDPNQATWVEWMQLEGIGEVLARRIVEDREANGPFESVDAIARVRGVGPKTVEKLRPWLEIRPVE